MDNTNFKEGLETELKNILAFWERNTIDHENGGFIGRIDGHGTSFIKAPKGIILNTRILWTFSRAGNFYGSKDFLALSGRAFNYLHTYFRDKTYGGVFWEVDHKGQPTIKKKQVYAQAFSIYALAEYYRYTKDKTALDWALEIFEFVERYAFEERYNGYLEAFSESWAPIEDLRLSEKDHNSPKTTNTMLHIMEAYTTLAEVTNNPRVKARLKNLLNLFLSKIFQDSNHLGLFYTMDWQETSGEVSYGHDIEAAWLLLMGAKALGDEESALLRQTEQKLKEVSDTFLNEALDDDYGVFNSLTGENGLDSDKHWWPQAEAIVGLTYAWQLTGNDTYLNNAKKIWSFTHSNVIDNINGEWFFRIDREGKPYMEENKVGPWKCPYHNSRALIQVIDILDNN